MGRYNTAFYSAVAVGPLIGGFLYELYGLKAHFHFCAVLGKFSIIIVVIRVTEPSWHEGSVTCRKGDEGLPACTEKQYQPIGKQRRQDSDVCCSMFSHASNRSLSSRCAKDRADMSRLAE